MLLIRFVAALLQVDVGPKTQTKIRAFGPGLENGIVGFPANFTVETNGETGALGKWHYCEVKPSEIIFYERFLWKFDKAA